MRSISAVLFVCNSFFWLFVFACFFVCLFFFVNMHVLNLKQNEWINIKWKPLFWGVTMVNAGKVSPDRLKSIVLLKWNQVVIEISSVNIKEYIAKSDNFWNLIFCVFMRLKTSIAQITRITWIMSHNKAYMKLWTYHLFKFITICITI